MRGRESEEKGGGRVRESGESEGERGGGGRVRERRESEGEGEQGEATLLHRIAICCNS